MVAVTDSRPKRRTVGRVLLAVVVLLPAWYVAAWLGVSLAVNHGIVGAGAGEAVRPAFKPLILYCDLRKPGSDTLHRLWWTVSANPEIESPQPGWFLAPSLPRPE
jgi:hypothetical protein